MIQGAFLKLGVLGLMGQLRTSTSQEEEPHAFAGCGRSLCKVYAKNIPGKTSSGLQEAADTGVMD